jgi:hypothetical protein
MKDKSAAQRIHSEAPAEGDEAAATESAASTDIRVHSQEPAEGHDPDEE